RLDHVETIHLAVVFRNAPPCDELARVTHRTRKRRRKEIAIERKHSLREIEAIRRVYWLTKSRDGAAARIVAIGRFILMPLRLRKRCQHVLHLRAERRRDDGLSQKPN